MTPRDPQLTGRLLSAGVTGPEGLALSRPEAVEAEAVRRACTLAGVVGCPLYLLHLTSPAAVDEVASARRRGHIVYGEATAAALATDGTHYWNSCWRHAAAHVTVPPLRPDPTAPARLADLLARYADGGASSPSHMFLSFISLCICVCNSVVLQSLVLKSVVSCCNR